MQIQQISLPFTCRQQRGKVDITLQPNNDPEHAWGLDLIFPHIPPISFAENFHGFPVVSAKVSYPDPAGPLSGYGSLFGWIQLIKADKEDRPGEWEIDIFPWAKDLGSPFSYWGHCPTAFDAPAKYLTEEDDWTRWRAQSFLYVLVDAGMSKRVVPVCGAGFSWGFDFEMKESEANGLGALERKIVLKNVEVMDVDGEWSGRVESLSEWFPDREFLDANQSI
jgi:hypothetical protein